MGERTCTIEGCDKRTVARGWCSKHYDRWRKHGDPLVTSRIIGDDKERFLSKVDRRGDDECWPWLGNHTEDGYGQLTIGETTAKAHRLAHEYFIGPIPDGYEVDHVRANGCTRTDCVNWVSHLEAVTPQENRHRSNGWGAVNARKTHCPEGHPYDEENTRISRGRRECLTCVRRYHRELMRTKRGAPKPRATRLCSLEECERKHYCRGYCRTHYERWKTHGDPRKTLLPREGEVV